MLTTTLIVGWGTLGLLGWWIVVRYIHKRIGVGDLLMLPLVVLLGGLGLIMAIVTYTLVFDLSIKRWK